MRHFSFLDEGTLHRLFETQPEHVDRKSEAEVLAVALGATLYSPGTRSDLAGGIRRQAARGVTSMVLCLEDAIADGEVPEGEANIVRALTTLHTDGDDDPLLFVRVRHVDQIADLCQRLGPAVDVLSGFVLPKFGARSGALYLDALQRANDRHGTRLLAMPVMESPQIIHQETRQQALSGVQEVLSAHRDLVLAVRIGATDLASAYGLRRSPDLTVYDVRLVAQVIIDVINRLGRADGSGHVITGPVWEYFTGGERIFKPRLRETIFEQHNAAELRSELISKDLDGLIREVELDKANGLTGKTVIHPSHVPAVNALLVVSHEEFGDAQQVLQGEFAGGVSSSEYRNKMNEIKPHTAWAHRTMMRARAFGVAAPEITFVEILAASILT